VRKYLDDPIPPEIIEKLRARVAENNEKYGLDIKLQINDESVISPAAVRLLFTKNVKNYFLLAGDPAPDLDERLGYCGTDLMLYAQTLGLNTWWVGGTFNKKTTSELAGGKKVVGIIAVGYGATQGVPHRSKKPKKVSSYEGEAPQWFKDGVEAALLAPTAVNRQAFFIKGRGREVSITYNKGSFAGVDLGIVKYHFELGAGKENFEWGD